MDNSILNTTKKNLGLGSDYTAFDLDILTHINAAFSTLCQLGVGPPEGFYIEDDQATWDDFLDRFEPVLSMAKTYVYLKVRLAFDPPTTSFGIEAVNRQVSEMEWRMNVMVDPHPPSQEAA